MVQVFLVGGAVRDLMMGIVPKDFDFVVVGANPDMMLAAGFEAVGADFPVFLDGNGNEFALARKERKSGEGHTGFKCEWEGVTLEEDLLRRDLTINAMALKVNNGDEGDWVLRHLADGLPWTARAFEPFLEEVIDPFGAMQDVSLKCLIHTSEAFEEDPLRVLRVARFLARFGAEWTVEQDTKILCKRLCMQGKLDELTPERVWKEMSRALMEPHPEEFFKFLHSISWDGIKELSDLVPVEQRPDFHPEGNAFVHTMLCVQSSARNGDDLPTRFAVLMHDLGKRPAFDFNRSQGKNHLGGHEHMGLPLIDAFCDRFKVPNDCRDFAKLISRDHTNIHNLHRLKPNTIGKMFNRWNLLGKPRIAVNIIRAVQADARGRGEEFEDMKHPNEKLLRALVGEFVKKVSVDHVQHQSKKKLEGAKIGEAIFRERVRRLKETKDFMLAVAEAAGEANPR